MDTRDLAWAAGFFDAEGSISHHLPTKRRTRRATFDVSQSGDGKIPDVLMRFRDVVGAGSIFGPYRGYLYYWRTHDTGIITSVVALLWPWLTDEKRAQIRATLAVIPALWCAEEVGRLWAARLNEFEQQQEQLAWAAGLFDGDGTIGAYTRGARSRHLHLTASVVQASSNGIPPPLARFNQVVGLGNVNGPYPPRGWSKLPQYRWQLGGQRVETAISLLRPWLSPVRLKQAEDALEAARLTRADTSAI